jgi:hypothetical protein
MSHIRVVSSGTQIGPVSKYYTLKMYRDEEVNFYAFYIPAID